MIPTPTDEAPLVFVGETNLGQQVLVTVFAGTLEVALRSEDHERWSEAFIRAARVPGREWGPTMQHDSERKE